MTPERTTHLSLQFASASSPWWLLLLVPGLLALTWWLYRGQWRDLSRPVAAGLTALRALLLVGLAIVLFRPNLIFREVLTYPGRVVVVVDDSASMTTRDTSYSGPEALRLARDLGQADTPLHSLANRLDQVAAGLRAFESTTRDMNRTDDRFWTRAEATQSELNGILQEVAQQTPAAGAAVADPAALSEAVAAVNALNGVLTPFFTGDAAPGAKAYDAACRQITLAEELLLALQAGLDRTALAAGDASATAQVAALRERQRLSLLQDIREGALRRLQAGLPGQAVQSVSLMSGRDLAATGDWTAQPGTTDVVTRLAALGTADSDFPLSALVYAGDGRDLGGGGAAALARELARRQVPVFTAGTGSEGEPTDVAVLDVVAPPFAVTGRPVTVRLRLKTALPEPVTATVEVRPAGNAPTTPPLTSETVTLGERAEQEVVLRITPTTVGLQAFTIHVAALPGEVFPTQNNDATVTMQVRDEMVKVLFLDEKPRWETRFALNILQRLDYLDLNAIVTLVQPDGRLQRGVTKGTWPQDAATLAMYDVIVVGDLPDGTLTDAEWTMLRDAVTLHGKTLLLLGNGRRTALPVSVAGLREALLPVAEHGDTAGKVGTVDTVDTAPALDALSLTAAGRLHPLTRALADVLPIRDAAASATAKSPERASAPERSLVLLTDGAAGRPVLALRYTGAGKTVALESDLLWKRLNANALDAHAALFVEAVSWGVNGDRAAVTSATAATEKATTNAPASPTTGLLRDRSVIAAGESFQVWLTDAAPGAVVELCRGDEVLASAEATPLVVGTGNGLSRAVFAAGVAPAGALTVRLKGAPTAPADDATADGGAIATRSLLVLDTSPELRRLSQDAPWLRRLAGATGGEYLSFATLDRFASAIKPKTRVEKLEHVWRLWDSGWILVAVFVLLTAEWIWRKLAGLV